MAGSVKSRSIVDVKEEDEHHAESVACPLT
jgi:hypothetical protein